MWVRFRRMTRSPQTYIRNALADILSAQSAHNVGVNVGANVGVNEAESMCLRILRENPRLSAQKIADQMGLSARALEASIYITVDTLKYLKKGGRIERMGAAKNGYWKIVDSTSE